MSANHGDYINIENKFSSRKESITGTVSPELLMRERKFATWFSLLGQFITVILNSYNNSSHLVTMPSVIGLFIKYRMVEWSV